MTTRESALTFQRLREPLVRQSFYRGAAVEFRDSGATATILAILLLFLLPVSLIPSTRGILFRLYPLPTAWWTDNLVVIFAVSVLVLRLLGPFSRPIARSTRRWLLLPILALGLWQTISLTWNGRDGFMRSYSFLQSLFMCAAVLSGVLLASGLSGPTRFRVGRGITLFIAFIAAVYGGLSFIFPSWRPSTAWMDRTTLSLGFIRVFGPLGGATTLNFVLTPALGFSVGMALRPGMVRLFWGATSVFFVAAIVLTGSRGGLVSLAAFTAILVVSLRLRSLAFLLPVGLALGSLVLFVGLPERFRNLEDRARAETYATAWRALVSRTQNFAIGTGHGALYSKLHDDMLRKTYGKNMWYLAEDRTQFGYTLRSSHSAILRSLVETGVVGFALSLTPLLWLGGRLLRPRSARLRQPIAIFAKCTLSGCLAIVPYFAFEEFFINAFWIVVLWTMFAVIGAEALKDENELTLFGPRGSVGYLVRCCDSYDHGDQLELMPRCSP
jgi:hypothetical protein